tara:strand:+ start:5202 stop:6212 length:1011 start_codon:yes stop_codon:yes gene_type:complete
MAEFFDKKEDVMDIQLTQYGKHLLSKGEFSPTYYAFYDQDIIYDGKYGTGNETQNDAQHRIKNLTSYTKAQYVFRGIDTYVNTLNNQVVGGTLNIDDPKKQEIQDKVNALSMPIGACNPNSEKSPAWRIQFLKAPLSASVDFYTGSAEKVQQIPQLEAHHTVFTSPALGLTPQEEMDEAISFSTAPPENQLDQTSEIFFDESFYNIAQQYVFLDVLEDNGVKNTENFEIEVFLVEDGKDSLGNSIEILNQLYFAEDLEEYNMGTINYEDIYNDPNYVEHYFTIDVDQDIRDEILCDVKFENKIKDYKTDIELQFDCPDQDEEGVIYGTTDEDVEVC